MTNLIEQNTRETKVAESLKSKAQDGSVDHFASDQIQSLLAEYRKRKAQLDCQLTGTGEDITEDQLNWMLEPSLSALKIEPTTAREMAALYLISVADSPDYCCSDQETVVFRTARRIVDGDRAA